MGDAKSVFHVRIRLFRVFGLLTWPFRLLVRSPSYPRTGLFRFFWLLTWPLRLYVMRSSIPHRRRFIIERIIKPILPHSPASFVAHLAGGETIELRYREQIGLTMLVYGEYEAAEVESLSTLAKEGSTVIDVGANVGMFTLPLARAVGDAGTVLAFEPILETAERLRANINRNRVANIEVLPVAAGAVTGHVPILLANDPAYVSTVHVKMGRAAGTSTVVPVVRLDDVWLARGRPRISVMKIDVEGAELSVLDGAKQILSECHPVLLLEADAGPQLDALLSRLRTWDYVYSHPHGFNAWNHLFRWSGTS